MTPPPSIILEIVTDEGLPGLMTYSPLQPTPLDASRAGSGSGLRSSVAHRSFQFISHVGTHQESVTLSVPEKQRKTSPKKLTVAGW